MRRLKKHIKKVVDESTMKFIRINANTLIQVDASIPDNVARENFLNKTTNTPADRWTGRDYQDRYLVREF